MSTSNKIYDAFISFRGEDTRDIFAIPLRDALENKNIDTYIDIRLKRGQDVWPSLVEAIKNSRISIVVFSENFATSTWCLNEILEIIKCRKLYGQEVIPVFYKTDPSHVREQKESYKEPFEKYEIGIRNHDYTEERVLSWKAGLTEVANTIGCDSRNFRDDVAAVIKNVVRDVSKKLTLMHPKNFNDIVIDENCKQVESLLNIYARIGIWGMGGIGKTTIAKFVFGKHFEQYDGVCFMENVNEQIENDGVVQVRDKILSKLLKRQITKLDFFGDTFINKSERNRKVFIVLDNVDSIAQLKSLCGALNGLGENTNSRLVITTRDKRILERNVDEIHEVTKWSFQDSLKIFISKAFEQGNPQQGYDSVLKEAVDYAGGVPLALEFLSSHFYSKDLAFWKSKLNYLKNEGECFDRIQQVLQVSYKGLQNHEREIFLDIAFFFESEDKDFAMRILDASGFDGSGGIKILEEKALITISNRNKIEMHGLLQKMAFNIVRNDQGLKHSRLRDIEEIRYVLKNTKGVNVVEGIQFDLSQKEKLDVRADTFNKMVDLRFLRLYVPLGKTRLATVSHTDQGIMQFSDKLRYFEWNGYLLKSLPDPFCAKHLVEIRLPHSNVEYLWHGLQELMNLEAIDLTECKHLINLPDLSQASKLKWLYLSGCESLCEIQPSIFSKDTLVTLILDRCTKLESLKSEKHLRSLQKISVDGCSSLKEFSLSSDSIESLDLSNTGVEILHSSISGMRKLGWLNLEGLKLSSLPNELSGLGLLTEFRISNCDIVTKSMLEGMFHGLRSLKTLYLKHCGNLLELPTNIGSLSSLYELRLDGSSVEMLPSSMKFLSQLEILYLNNCIKLHSLPELPLEIKEIHAENCTSLVTVSSLKTFSEQMKGKEKHISFKNDNMRNSNQPFHRVVEDVILTIKSAAFHNILVKQPKLDSPRHNYNYNSARVCLPGSRVPRQFKYRTSDSKITIGFPEIYHSLGFIFSVVISPSNRMKNDQGSGAKIQCKCYGEDGNKVGLASEWYSESVTNLNMDHVFVWYDPYHSDSILESDKTTLSFEFNLTTNMCDNDGFFSLKECGICPIFSSELPRLLSKINLCAKVKSDLFNAVQQMSKSIGTDHEMEGSDITSIDMCDEEENAGISCMQQHQELDMIEKHEKSEGNHTESVERCNEKESTIELIQRQNQELDCNEKHEGRECIHIESVERRDEEKSISESIQIQNQKSDLNEKCHCLYDCVIGPLSCLWRLLCN